MPKTHRRPRRAHRLRTLAFRVGLICAVACCAATAWLAIVWFTLPDVTGLARTNPRTTALIEQRREEAAARGRKFTPRQTWTTLDRVSPRLVQAVVLSEDAKFFGHEGFDWEAIRDAAEKGLEQRRFSRGGSTITQQLAKNLYLGTERTFWRKAKEAMLAVKLERALSKRRILALYLNVAEWGHGTFGIEAASRRWFGCSAARLTPAQSAILASMLPAPRRAELAPAPRWLARRARRCLASMRAAGRLDAEEYALARAELERLLAGDAGGEDEPPESDAVPVAEAAPEILQPAEASEVPHPADVSEAPHATGLPEASHPGGLSEVPHPAELSEVPLPAEASYEAPAAPDGESR